MMQDNTKDNKIIKFSNFVGYVNLFKSIFIFDNNINHTLSIIPNECIIHFIVIVIN